MVGLEEFFFWLLNTYCPSKLDTQGYPVLSLQDTPQSLIDDLRTIFLQPD